MNRSLHKKLADIARQHLHIETLETRGSDRLDFHEVSVWGVKAALQAAYEYGQASLCKPKSPGILREAEILLKACLNYAKAADGDSNDAEHDAALDMQSAAIGFLRSAAAGDGRLTALIDKYMKIYPELD
jgi:hypothetical protein